MIMHRRSRDLGAAILLVCDSITTLIGLGEV